MRAQLDKATADAAEFKAGFAKALYDNFEQKAQVGSRRSAVQTAVHVLWHAPRS
jgi:hypothetical protein